jgi:hypothetical protein
LQATFVEAPPEHTLPTKCIIGEVEFGRVVHTGALDLDHPWALPSVGKYCYAIVASREFEDRAIKFDDILE